MSAIEKTLQNWHQYLRGTYEPGLDGLAGVLADLDPTAALLEAASAPAALADRQLEVLRLIGRGLTNREIGEVLGIGAVTVKTHTLAIYAALDVTNRAEAVMAMRDLGLEESGDS
jgi:DNA-binding NarL/FixJ family response regulator